MHVFLVRKYLPSEQKLGSKDVSKAKRNDLHYNSCEGNDAATQTTSISQIQLTKHEYQQQNDNYLNESNVVSKYTQTRRNKNTRKHKA